VVLKGFAGFAIKKVGSACITIFAIVCANFVIFRLVPGDPLRMMFRDPRVSAEQMQLVRERFGLDKPLGEQFLCYLREMAQGNMGISFWQKRPALEVVADRVPQTLLLIVTALTIAIILGTIFGAIAGSKMGTRSDSVILSIALSLYSIPAFCMGIILMLIFAFQLSIFPLGGISTAASGFTGFEYWKDVAWHMFLPALCVVFWYGGEYVLLTRSAMVDALGQDYIITARAKGLKESAILKNHALRNALLPVVTITGVNLAFAVAGIIEVETVFSWPGVGRLVYDAVMKRDYPVLQATFVVLAVAIVFANLVVDLIYGYIDPRIKVGGGE